MTEFSFDIAKYNELFEKMKKSLQKLEMQSPSSISANISIPMSTSALQLARAELGYAYAMAQEAREETYRTRLIVYGCTKEEASEIVRLCQKCAEQDVRAAAFNYYVDLAIGSLGSGETVDEVRYHLYQTSMSNRPDDLKTDEPEEGFFK